MYCGKVSRSQGAVARPAIPAFVLALSFAAFVGSYAVGFSATDNQESGSGLVRFNIPSQPLVSALEAYARISGREVLYDGALAVGLRSNAIEGVYAPVEALHVLLAGTGLSAQFEDADFFVLTTQSTRANAVDAGQLAVQQRYFGRLQASLRGVFCQKREIVPGRYRIAARLWIGPSGDVVQEKRLASTGDADLDRDVDDALRGIKLGSPPAGLEQPITIVIMPNAPGVRQDCQESGTGLAPAKAAP
jgi:TonB C terminal